MPPPVSVSPRPRLRRNGRRRAAGEAAAPWGERLPEVGAAASVGGAPGEELSAGERVPGLRRAGGTPHGEAVELPGVFLGVGLLHLPLHQADGVCGQRPGPPAIPLQAGLQRAVQEELAEPQRVWGPQAAVSGACCPRVEEARPRPASAGGSPTHPLHLPQASTGPHSQRRASRYTSSRMLR